MGGMLSDRETLIKTDIFVLSDTKQVNISKAIEMEEYPVKPNCVRMDFFKGSQIEVVGNDIHITEFQTMDLKGYFPKSIMNKVQSKMLLERCEMTFGFVQKVDTENGWTPSKK
jgi:hypothetical protein